MESDKNSIKSNGSYSHDNNVQSISMDSKGVKRSRIDMETDSNNGSLTPLHETLTPRISRCPTPLPAQDIEFFDDECHEEFEWVRLPKKRNFDLFKVARWAPEERNSAELPLTARRHHDGQDVVLWAKMDTAADANAINRSTLEALLGDSAKKSLRTITLDGDRTFAQIGNNHFDATHYVVLDFWAGVSKRKFEAVKFILVDDDWQDPNGDGIPNVLLGWPFLREQSMVMMDFEYHHYPDSAFPVIAERAENEKANQAMILVNMYPQTRGVPRPRPVKK